MSKPEDNIQPFKEDLIPVDGKEGWYRDPDSNAIVNCNQTQYDSYMASYAKREKQQAKFDTLQSEVSELKSDISDIKELLKLAIGEKNNAS
tara:strand:+ start:2247 stop:2519 length:273 start_codon:yes stop_codon:yes gene_type:complete